MSFYRISRHFVSVFIAILMILSTQGGCMLGLRPPPQQQARNSSRHYDDPQSTDDGSAANASALSNHVKNAQELPQASEPSADKRREVQELVEQALTAPQMDQRTAIALRASDRAVAGVTDTLAAIEAAEKLIVTNLRNAATPGYKSIRSVTGETRDVSLQLDMEQGRFENTSRPLDLAIQGSGFFAVKNAAPGNGPAVVYTRNGNFFVNNLGELVIGLGKGYKLIPPVVIPAGTTDISIAQDGQIAVVTGKGDPGVKRTIGQLSLACFVDPSKLTHLSGSLYYESAESGTPVESKAGDGGAGAVLQGFLEDSNVDLMRERVRLRFLQGWQQSLIRAIEDEPRTAAPARGQISGRE